MLTVVAVECVYCTTVSITQSCKCNQWNSCTAVLRPEAAQLPNFHAVYVISESVLHVCQSGW